MYDIIKNQPYLRWGIDGGIKRQNGWWPFTHMVEVEHDGKRQQTEFEHVHGFQVFQTYNSRNCQVNVN